MLPPLAQNTSITDCLADQGSRPRSQFPSLPCGTNDWLVLLRGGGQHPAHQQDESQGQRKELRLNQREHTRCLVWIRRGLCPASNDCIREVLMLSELTAPPKFLDLELLPPAERRGKCRLPLNHGGDGARESDRHR